MEDSLKERILTSARELFFEQGYYRTTTREIAKNAKTSESGVFRLFDSKYAILMSVYNSAWGKVNLKIDKELANDFSPKEKIICIANVVFKMYEDDKKTMSFIIMNTGNTDTLILERKENSIISNENKKYIIRLEELCKHCSELKMVNHRLDAQSLCEGIMSVIEGVLLGWYLADTSDNYPYRLSLEQALNLIRIFFDNYAKE